jgi:hypothetical protein
MTKPTAELACRDMVTGLRITVDGSVQKVEMPKNAILAGLYAAIGCDAVDVVRLADQLDMWIDDEGLYNSQANPLATKLRTTSSATSPTGTGNRTSAPPCSSASTKTPEKHSACSAPTDSPPLN